MPEKTKKQVDPFDDDTEKMKRAAKRMMAMQQLMKAQTGLGSIMDQPKPPEQQPATPTPMVNRMANMPQPWAIPAAEEMGFMPKPTPQPWNEFKEYRIPEMAPNPTFPLGPEEQTVKLKGSHDGYSAVAPELVAEDSPGSTTWSRAKGAGKYVAPELVVGGRGGSGQVEAPEPTTYTETSPDPGSGPAQDGRAWPRYLSTVKEWANNGEKPSAERLAALEKRFPGVLKLIKKDLIRGISGDESGYQPGMAMPGLGPSLTTDLRQDPAVLEAENERDLLRMSKDQRLLRSLNAETPMAKAMYDALDRAEGKRRLKR